MDVSNLQAITLKKKLKIKVAEWDTPIFFLINQVKAYNGY
jgi:hypothetical protein